MSRPRSAVPVVTAWDVKRYDEGGIRVTATIDGAAHLVYAHPMGRRAPAAANCHTCGHSASCAAALLALAQMQSGQPPALADAARRP